MNGIKRFDEERKQICQDAFLMSRFGGGLLCCLGMLFMLFPVREARDTGMLGTMLLGCVCCANGVCQWITPYVSIREEGRRVSIYKKLEYMPVTRAQIRKVRYGYLNRICIRLGAAAFVIQQAVSWADHSFGIVSMLFAAAWGAAVWIAGGILICWR